MVATSSRACRADRFFFYRNKIIMKATLLAAIASLLFSSGSASANLLHDLIAKRGGLETIQIERRLDEQLFRLAGECKAAGGRPSEFKVSGEDAEVARGLDCAIDQKRYAIELAGERGTDKDASLMLTVRFQAPLREASIGLVESELFEQRRAMVLPSDECTPIIDAAAGVAALWCRGAATTAAYAKVSAVRYAPWTEQAKQAKATREKAFSVPAPKTSE